MSIRYVALATFAVSMPGAAHAQTDAYAVAHAAAANQMGVLEYCQSRGDVGADSLAAQRTAIARLPASTANNDRDEALGKQGTLAAPNGAKMTLDSIASSRGTTVSALCKQMGSAVIQSANAVQQNSSPAGGMTMPKMPSMPNGVTMPSMPGVPGTQSR